MDEVKPVPTVRPDIPPQILRRSTVTELPPGGASCHGCSKPLQMGQTVFYRLKANRPDKLIFCASCGDGAAPYVEAPKPVLRTVSSCVAPDGHRFGVSGPDPGKSYQCTECGLWVTFYNDMSGKLHWREGK